MPSSKIQVALAQIAPVWLFKQQTIEKVIHYVEQAAKVGTDLIAFSEGLLPGYPFWLSFTHASAFNNDWQKTIHAHYVSQAICIEDGDLDAVRKVCREKNIACYLGIIERPKDRGGHSLYCSLVYIDKEGIIQSVHRKLRPTYEERLAWSPGDGHGLLTHPLEGFTVGGLNCWENWMPLPRTALYAQGENVHVAVWPGSTTNTEDITRFIAKESRSYVLSVSSVFTKEDIPSDLPFYTDFIAQCPSIMANGGSCISNPDGTWLIAPSENEEKLLTAELDLLKVYQERQNMDPAGHYTRPDVTQLHINRERQGILKS